MSTATIHIDGAARGNPGPAAYAVVIQKVGEPAIEVAATMGHATNNVAEYTALVKALEKAAELGLKRLDIFSDSELLVKQMNGEYRVKHPDLLPLFQAASALQRKFDNVSISHVRREMNKRADQLGNEVLDAAKPKAAPSATAAKLPSEKRLIGDDHVREDAVICLAAAAKAWGANGGTNPAPVIVWEQLWSLLEENGLLKSVKK
ncbi:hypothetical protein BH11PLA2_BH11PLA2_42970 [soil metagenome]